MGKYTGYDQKQAERYKRYIRTKAVVTVRMSEEEKAAILRNAEAEGKSVNRYVIDRCVPGKK